MSISEKEKELNKGANTGSEELGKVTDHKNEGEIEIRDDISLANELSGRYGLPYVSLSNRQISPEVIQLVSRDLAHRHKLIPLDLLSSNLIQIALSDPSDVFAIDDIKFTTGYEVEVVVSSESEIKEAITRYYGTQEEHEQQIATELEKESEKELSRVIENIGEGLGEDVDLYEYEEESDDEEQDVSYEDAPIIKLVNFILTNAVKKGASDIHIEPSEKDLRIRYRMDGVLSDDISPPVKAKNAISSRIKIMAGMNIAERRLPQDGRIKMRIPKKGYIEYRVSSIPTVFGEKVVLRVLDKGNLQFDLEKLGFNKRQLEEFRKSIFQPHGMVLITGPTGSGKTTTLYSSLMEMNNNEVNISTAEDPVEYTIQGINQVRVHEDIGLTFASCLRAFLRQDPDIILVGEIRDYETAEISIKAALTGHLVLSTLHTNDSVSTIARLLNIGIEPFLIASSLNAIVAQRLVRLICDNCKDKVDVIPQLLINNGVPSEEIGKFDCFAGTGCDKCYGTGYKGRISVYEVLVLTQQIKDLIMNGALASEIKKAAIDQGMLTLRQSALGKLKAGLITIDEVIKISGKDG